MVFLVSSALLFAIFAVYAGKLIGFLTARYSQPSSLGHRVFGYFILALLMAIAVLVPILFIILYLETTAQAIHSDRDLMIAGGVLTVFLGVLFVSFRTSVEYYGRKKMRPH